MHTQKHTEEAKEKMRQAHLGIPRPDNAKESIVENGIKKYKCSTCKEYFNKEGFYKCKKCPVGIKSQCKKCHCKTSVKTQDKEKTREREKLRARRLRAENSERLRTSERNRKKEKSYKTVARDLLNKAVKKGIVQKPLTCYSCGEQKRLTAHHSDYNQPYLVDWLCYECHAKEHRLDFKLVK